MDWRAACAAVIPCLNEAATIGPLVLAVRTWIPTVYVVDDGSCDSTGECAAKAGAMVQRHPHSLGKGSALQNGCGQARAAGFTWALTLDGDGQHSPDDIPSFLNRAQTQPVSLVVGNRMGQAAQIPVVRRWVNRYMSSRLSRLTRQPLPDSQCGFRLIHLEDWARLPIRTSHFEVESEMLFRFAQAGLRIEFVPIRVIYKAEQSKIHPWRDTVRWLKWLRQARREGPRP